MKRLLAKLALLLLPFAAVLVFVEYRLRRLPNSYSETRAEIERRAPEIEIVATGTSHVLAAIRPGLLGGEALNLAGGSQSLHYDTRLVLKYAPLMPRLRVVIFGVSYHSLEYRLANSIERWRGGFYRQVHGVEPEGGDEGLQLSNYSYIALYTPKEAWRRVLGGADGGGGAAGGETAAAAANQAAGGAAQQGEVSEEFGLRRVRLHESQMYQRDLGPNREALERACRELKARGVAVVLITTPVHRTYAEHIRPENYRRMQETMGQVAAGCGAEYFNFLADARFGDGDFFDSDHLGPKGAEKFSRILAREVVAKYLARPEALDFSQRIE